MAGYLLGNYPSGQRLDIKALAEKVSERYNISIDERRSGGAKKGRSQSQGQELVLKSFVDIIQRGALPVC